MTLRLIPTPLTAQRLAQRAAIFSNVAIVQSASASAAAADETAALQTTVADQATAISTLSDTVALINDRVTDLETP